MSYFPSLDCIIYQFRWYLLQIDQKVYSRVFRFQRLLIITINDNLSRRFKVRFKNEYTKNSQYFNCTGNVPVIQNYFVLVYSKWIMVVGQPCNYSEPIYLMLKKFFHSFFEQSVYEVFFVFIPGYIFLLFFMILIDPLPDPVPYLCFGTSTTRQQLLISKYYQAKGMYLFCIKNNPLIN